MKTIDIVGDNYFGRWDKTRTACRGIILKDRLLLLSYETVTGQWMLPGGGLEEGEDERACCVREHRGRNRIPCPALRMRT